MMALMSKGTPRRTIRVPDKVWEAAQRRAEVEKTTVSDVVQEFLANYSAADYGVADPPTTP